MPGGARWLAELPRIVEACADAWSLALGEPFTPALALGGLAILAGVGLAQERR